MPEDLKPDPTKPVIKAEELPAPGSKPGAGQPADYVDRLVARYGNERSALQILGDDNFNLRERHRLDTEEINKLRPLTLTTEQLEEFLAFTTLGIKAAEVKTKLEKLPELERKVADSNEQMIADEAARLAGFNKPKLLKKLMKDAEDGFDIEIRTEKGKDEAGNIEVKRVAYARRKADKDGQFVPFTDYANEHLTDYIPSLTADEASSDSSNGGEKIVPFPRQTPKPNGQGSKSKASVANDYLKAQYETPGQSQQKQ